ncbi:hypothetical protein BH10PLA2_BH10PLA2_17850 [soil metagenome]
MLGHVGSMSSVKLITHIRGCTSPPRQPPKSSQSALYSVSASHFRIRVVSFDQSEISRRRPKTS